MTIDCVDATEDLLDIFENKTDRHETAIWNGREITVIDPNHFDQWTVKAQAIIQSLNEEKQQLLTHYIEQLDSLDELDVEWRFASASLEHEFILADTQQSQDEILQCGLFKKAWDVVRKSAKKAAKVFRKILDAVKKAAEEFAHGTKKAAEKVADFVKDHKKETLIAAAVIAAIAGAFIISGALSGGAAATGGGTPTRRKEDEKDDKTSPPSDPPPLPDWVSDLLKSTAPDFSPDKLTEASLENVKKEAHDAWDLLNRLKLDTENSLVPLKEFKPEFNPSSHAVETILNTVLQDPQKYEFSKNLISSQNWTDFIKSGHDKIDRDIAFLSGLQMPINPLPQKSPPTFLDKIRLGLEIIGRGMMEPELLDPNSPLDQFFKSDQKTVIPIENPNQTISEFLKDVENKLKNEQELLMNPVTALSNASQPSAKVPKIFELDLVLPFGAAGASSLQEKSRDFTVKGNIRAGTLITFINGMDNIFAEAEMNAKHLQKLCPFNPSIEGIYNHTNGPLIDVLEIFKLNYKGYSPITQDLLVQKWTEFHQQNKDDPDAKILHFCHSQGAIHTKNALLHLPEEIRNRIIVVAIAPAAVISRSLCHDSFNYASKNDIVPSGELLAAYWRACDIGETEVEELLINIGNMQNELIRLTPHEKATGYDHAFQSPTFVKTIKKHLKAYYLIDDEE